VPGRRRVHDGLVGDLDKPRLDRRPSSPASLSPPTLRRRIVAVDVGHSAPICVVDPEAGGDLDGASRWREAARRSGRGRRHGVHPRTNIMWAHTILPPAMGTVVTWCMDHKPIRIVPNRDTVPATLRARETELGADGVRSLYLFSSTANGTVTAISDFDLFMDQVE